MNKFLVQHPLISEKATDMSAFGKYVFRVDARATSPEIRKIVEGHYKVHVTRVQVLNVKSKRRRLGRSVGTKPGYKKAIVTLKAGEKLDVLPH